MNSKKKWNLKHSERMNQLKVPTPNPRLVDLSDHLMGGTALDLACGLGGNSLFLAGKNYQVHAMDISDVAISYIQEKAEIDSLTIDAEVVDLTDLDNRQWQKGSYNLVVITFYLDRSLFPIAKHLVKEGGHIFIETFYQSRMNENKGVSNQYKLMPKELLSEFEGWTVLYFEENEEEGRQTIFCQK